jgi:putative protease
LRYAAVVRDAPLAEASEVHLLVRNAEQLGAAIEFRPASITLDYLDLYGLRPSVERVKQSGIAVRVASPRVVKPGEERILNFLVSLGCPILVRPAGMLHALREISHASLIGDFSLNAANSVTAETYLAMGLERLTPTHDLNAAQVAELARSAGAERIEVVAYHHLPVFHTEHCVFCRFLSTGTSYRDCGRPCEKYSLALQDSSGRAHPVLADVGCRNTVFGAEAQEASRHFEEWKRAGIRHFRLEFVHESAEEVKAIARVFREALAGEITPQELAGRLKKIAPQGTTEGSLFVPADYLKLPILQ